MKMNTQIQSQVQTQKINKPNIGKIVFLGEKNNWKIYMSFVQSTSSQDKIYQTFVYIHKSGALRFKCMCDAGRHNFVCKHATALYNALVYRQFKVDIDLTNQAR